MLLHHLHENSRSNARIAALKKQQELIDEGAHVTVSRHGDVYELTSIFPSNMKLPAGKVRSDHEIWLCFPEGVFSSPWPYEMLMGDPELAFHFARDVIGGPFPRVEDIIAVNAVFSYNYADSVLNGRFLKGEAAIATDGDYAYRYARDVTKAPFPAGENAIANHSPNVARLYANFVIKGRWEKGEASIAKDARESLQYATNVLKGPFPAGEPAMRRDISAFESYKKFIDSLL